MTLLELNAYEQGRLAGLLEASAAQAARVVAELEQGEWGRDEVVDGGGLTLPGHALSIARLSQGPDGPRWVADEMRQCLFPAVVALRSGKLSKVNKALLRLSALADALARIPVKGAR